MTDLEPSQSRDPKPQNGPRFPGFELSRYITFAIAIALTATFLCLPVPRNPAHRISELEDPVRVVVRTFERDLEIDSAVSAGQPWLRRTLEIVMNWPDAPLIAASDAYGEVYSARAGGVSSSPDETSSVGEATSGGNSPSAGETPSDSSSAELGRLPARQPTSNLASARSQQSSSGPSTSSSAPADRHQSTDTNAASSSAGAHESNRPPSNSEPATRSEPTTGSATANLQQSPPASELTSNTTTASPHELPASSESASGSASETNSRSTNESASKPPSESASSSAPADPNESQTPGVATSTSTPASPNEPTLSAEQLADIAAHEDLQVRRAILLAEAGNWDEADRALQLVEDDQPELSDLVRRAYGQRERKIGRVVDGDVARLHPGWVRTRLELRLAERRGDTVVVERMLALESEKGDALRRRTGALVLLFSVPLVLGLVILSVWLLRNRPALAAGSVVIPPSWTWERGFAILVRAAFAGLAIATLLLIAGASFELELVSVWTTLFASIPMMWWIRHYLALPARVSLPDMFGLVPSGRSVFAWIGLVLAVIAVDQLGSSVIAVALRAAGIEAHWSELAQEQFIFGSTPFAALRFVDGAVWAPIFEEIGCRGLLYLTLRKRLGPAGAAMVSGALFSAVHLYSLPGLLSVWWSGIVYAVAVERSRSLLPAMAAHAFNNAFALGGAWLFYR